MKGAGGCSPSSFRGERSPRSFHQAILCARYRQPVCHHLGRGADPGEEQIDVVILRAFWDPWSIYVGMPLVCVGMKDLATIESVAQLLVEAEAASINGAQGCRMTTHNPSAFEYCQPGRFR